MEKPARVGQAFRRGQSFWAGIAFVQKPFRISFDLNNPVSSNTDEEAASAVIHSRAVGPLPENLFGHSCPFHSFSLDPIAWGGGHGKARPRGRGVGKLKGNPMQRVARGQAKLRKNLLCKDKGIFRPEEIKRRSRPSKERVGAAAKGSVWLPSISNPSCLSIRLSSCFESDLRWPRVKSVMDSLPFSTLLRVQNTCQAVQPSDNLNVFRQLEDFDHETMKKG